MVTYMVHGWDGWSEDVVIRIRSDSFLRCTCVVPLAIVLKYLLGSAYLVLERVIKTLGSWSLVRCTMYAFRFFFLRTARLMQLVELTGLRLLQQRKCLQTDGGDWFGNLFSTASQRDVLRKSWGKSFSRLCFNWFNQFTENYILISEAKITLTNSRSDLASCIHHRYIYTHVYVCIHNIISMISTNLAYKSIPRMQKHTHLWA